MLELGNGDLTYEEEKSHFAMWAFAKAPLILGNDLSLIEPQTWSIITNKWLI